MLDFVCDLDTMLHNIT